MKNEKPDPVDFDRTSSPRAARHPKALTGMALLLPVLLLGAAIWQSGEMAPVGNGGGNGGIDATPLPPRAHVTSTPAVTEKPRQATYEIFAPNDNAELVRKSVPAPGVLLTREKISAHRTDLQIKLVAGAVKKLLSDYADFFPAGTALLGPVTLQGGYVNLNLNAAYAAGAESWSSAEAKTRVMSIVNTAIATKEQVAGSESDMVRLQIEGKPVQTLGPLDTAEPIEAEQAAASGATGVSEPDVVHGS